MYLNEKKKRERETSKKVYTKKVKDFFQITKGEKEKISDEKFCTGRDSNSDRPRGRRAFYP